MYTTDLNTGAPNFCPETVTLCTRLVCTTLNTNGTDLNISKEIAVGNTDYCTAVYCTVL